MLVVCLNIFYYGFFFLIVSHRWPKVHYVAQAGWHLSFSCLSFLSTERAGVPTPLDRQIAKDSSGLHAGPSLCFPDSFAFLLCSSYAGGVFLGMAPARVFQPLLYGISCLFPIDSQKRALCRACGLTFHFLRVMLLMSKVPR